MNTPLPTDPKARKDTPVVRGFLDYFPAAVAEVARVSKVGNDQHNPGEEMHHARGKSTDEADCIVRHLMERGTFDTDGLRHSAKVAWRAMSLLQKELEAAGAPLARGARLPVVAAELDYDRIFSSMPLTKPPKLDPEVVQEACGRGVRQTEPEPGPADTRCVK